jgi:hypothetical protein
MTRIPTKCNGHSPTTNLPAMWNSGLENDWLLPWCPATTNGIYQDHGPPAEQTKHYNSKTSKVSPATSMLPPPFLVIATQHLTVSMMPSLMPTDGLLNSLLFLGSSKSHPTRPTTSNGHTSTSTNSTSTTTIMMVDKFSLGMAF